MKKKLVLSLLVTFVVSSCGSTFASTIKCDDVQIYCSYQGLFHNVDGADEEFAMLLEPPKHSNFQDMYSTLLYIVGCQKENKECAEALKNPNCNISVYTQKLVNFYKANSTKFKDDKEKWEIVALFDMLKNGDGKIFFDEKIAANGK